MILEKVTYTVDVMGFKSRVLDYNKALKLSDNNFERFYLELMIEYKNNDGWWSRGRIPHCVNCHQVIPGPEQLRRYHKRSFHDDCFEKEWKTEREKGKESILIRKFFDRVVKLKLGR